MSRDPKLNSNQFPDEVLAYFGVVGIPKTEAGKEEVAAHFREGAAALQAMSDAFEKGAQFLGMDAHGLGDQVQVFMERALSGKANYPGEGISFKRTAWEVSGISTLIPDVEGVQCLPSTEGQLRIEVGEMECRLILDDPCMKHGGTGLRLSPNTPREAWKMASLFQRLANSLRTIGDRASYRARVPKGALCQACQENTVIPASGLDESAIANHRSEQFCCLCDPVIRQGRAMYKSAVTVWNGRQIRFAGVTEEVLQAVMESL
ncbi:hypothetical protein [Holophaga foetida]|uniref:hypothetical protein n=1 Tax=Holophaga foetida TaxID=35839 RepID=UPI0002472A44|nr:hypothetical protein [Holophaga foetida]